MSNKNNQKQYTREELQQMNYWQLWGLRRKSGLWYFLPLVGIYTFIVYCFFKVIYILAKSDTLEFKVDLWIIPVCLLAGLLYYYLHELYYKNFYLKNKEHTG